MLENEHARQAPPRARARPYSGAGAGPRGHDGLLRGARFAPGLAGRRLLCGVELLRDLGRYGEAGGDSDACRPHAGRGSGPQFVR